MSLVNKFERIVILKTLIFDIDLNFLDKSDLDKIAEYAYDMEVDLNHLLYDKLDYPTYDELREVFEEWKNDIVFMADDIRDELEKKING